MDDLGHLAELIARRNQVASEIAAVIGRPAQIGHVGEYIASRVFEIKLEKSASAKGIDGRFIKGPLSGRSVNVKWSTKHDGLINLTPQALPDYYLQMSGPKTGPVSSRGTTRPWVIDAVYLFDAGELVAELQTRGVKVGVATSVRQELWRAAEIYPTQREKQLQPSDAQRELLGLFRL